MQPFARSAHASGRIASPETEKDAVHGGPEDRLLERPTSSKASENGLESADCKKCSER